MNRSVWFGESKRSEKPWGHEDKWGGIFSGKQIFINADCRTSLKFNSHKSEALYVTSGKVLIEYADEAHFSDPLQNPSKTKVLRAGCVINIQAGCPYRLSALEDSVIFEISTSRIQDTKVILDDDYGRKPNSKKDKWIFKPTIEKQ